MAPQRQLYLYGFRSLQDNSIVKGSSYPRCGTWSCFDYTFLTLKSSLFRPGKYFHPLFMREYRSLCAKIVRPKSISTSSPKPKSRSSRASKPAYRKERMDTSNELKPNILYRLQDAVTGDGSTSPCVEHNQPFLLSGSVEPLSYTRSLTAHYDEAAGSKTPIDSYQLPIITGHISHRASEKPSHSLLKNMERAMQAVPGSASSSCSPDFSRGDVGPSHTPGNEDDFEIYSKFPEGPIYSISLGNSQSMDYQSCPIGSGDCSRLADPVSSWKYGTASIQQLEPYSESIIKLFGSSSALFVE